MEQVEDDMGNIKQELELVLIASAFYSHDDKVELLKLLRAIRGMPDTGWSIDCQKKIVRKSGGGIDPP